MTEWERARGLIPTHNVSNPPAFDQTNRDEQLKKKGGSKRSKVLGITKLDDANFAGAFWHYLYIRTYERRHQPPPQKKHAHQHHPPHQHQAPPAPPTARSSSRRATPPRPWPFRASASSAATTTASSPSKSVGLSARVCFVGGGSRLVAGCAGV